MCSQFSEVFQLCQYVLDNSQNAPLVGATLETLLRFLNWIPLGYIFETKLIDTLVFKFFNVPLFRYKARTFALNNSFQRNLTVNYFPEMSL